jgi:hypothetical protein
MRATFAASPRLGGKPCGNRSHDIAPNRLGGVCECPFGLGMPGPSCTKRPGPVGWWAGVVKDL